MTLKSATRLSSAAARSLRPMRAQSTPLHNCLIARPAVQHSRIAVATANPVRTFHASVARRSIMPDAENPAPKKSEESERPTVPTDISTSEYHQRADAWLEELFHRLEEQQSDRPDLEVDYSHGVLECSVQNDGTYVLNKQPANKQIWLSSPISGPKRFDWVVEGEGMSQKEGAGIGDWVYLRDGTSLTELVRKELGVELNVDYEAPH